MPTKPPRPASVTVIGWAWVVMGGLMAFSGLNGFLVWSLNTSPAFGGTAPPAPPAALGPVVAFVFEHFAELALVQVAFALFTVFSGIMFLRLRGSAHGSLQVVTTLALSFVVLFGINWVVAWVQLVPNQAFRILGVVMGTVVTVAFSVPLVVILRFLGSSSVRDACRP